MGAEASIRDSFSGDWSAFRVEDTGAQARRRPSDSIVRGIAFAYPTRFAAALKNQFAAMERLCQEPASIGCRTKKPSGHLTVTEGVDSRGS